MANKKEITFFRSIKMQMIFPILVFSILICLLLILVITPRQYRQSVRIMEENSKSLASAVSYGVGVGLEFEDKRAVADALEGVGHVPQVGDSGVGAAVAHLPGSNRDEHNRNAQPQIGDRRSYSIFSR